MYIIFQEVDLKRKQLSSEQKYLRVHSLVTHNEKRPVDDYLHTAHVAQFLMQVLKTENFFKTNNASE